ncbi:MAG: tRNA uridine-5-carboxymethylaminomethyl(34) synthesis GTPase MnmE [Chloroflexota bacterium]|nr:tRNA uridine-5-carboxymethylaminomethyl(34) synthesis GTPase MnmE [Chloroflexota bacterium]
MATATAPDTIAAIATALGPAGIGVVRVSGPGALAVARRIISDGSAGGLPDRVATLVLLRDPHDGSFFDQALVTYMAAPRSYTAEDVVEISCHGGIAAVRATLAAALAAGARLAEPGEFTLRAFLNGRIDLIQAEAVADMVAAPTDLSLKAAREQLGGRLSGEVAAARAQCLELLARLEAGIDFSEDDVPPVDRRQAAVDLSAVRSRLDHLLDQADRGRLLRTGVRLAIVGSPNVGKSSLLNALLRSDRAIVTDVPGTTRDTLEEQLDLEGIPVVVVDTAGVRGTTDAIESEGIARSRRALAEADVALLIFDAGRELNDADRAVAAMVREYGVPVLAVLNKSDLPEKTGDGDLTALGIDGPAVPTCALNDAGVAPLRTALLELIGGGDIRANELPLVTNERHQEALRAAAAHLEGSATAVADDLPADFIAIGLHGAVRVLGEVAGEDATEDLLANIFERFCIGK